MAKLWKTLFRSRNTEVSRYSLDQYAADRWFTYNGNGYPIGYGSSTAWAKTEDIDNNFVAYCQQVYKANGVVYGVMAARRLLFKQARFMWQGFADGVESDLFWTPDLEVLRKPWPNGTMGELLSRMDQDTSLGGNFYAVREAEKDGSERIRRLRPDWMTIVLTAPPAEAVKSDVAGYWFHPGRSYTAAAAEGPNTDRGDEWYLPNEVAHWTPDPDPEAQYRGMSWLTPVIREIQADLAATDHKARFFSNGATLGTVISAKENLTEEQFKQWMANFNSSHQGVENAYRPLFFASPVDVTVRGLDLRQLDFKTTQGHGETRVCAAGRVPPIIVGVSEGLEAATYSNYGQARRAFGDAWAHPQWEDAAGALETIVELPERPARLWYTSKHIAFLREDQKDAAEIQQTKAATITSLINAGFTPESVVAAVDADDRTLLVHTGLVSVQLQPPGAGVPTDTAAGELPGETPAEPPMPDGEAARGFNPHQRRDYHGRWTRGGGGKPGIVKVLEHANTPESKQELIDAANSVYGGEHAGFTTKVTKAYGYGKSKPDWLTVEGEIHDRNGRKVGSFERLLDRDDQGRRLVRHESLTLDREVRGQGFAESFNGAAEQWYRDNGIEYVELNANIDVGGYAWARQGYNWADEDAKAEVEDRLEEAIGDYIHRADFDPANRDVLLEQARQARELLDRSRAAETLDDAPTAYEFSQVGRPEGATGKDARWIGKDAMLGSDWEAVKWL